VTAKQKHCPKFWSKDIVGIILEVVVKFFKREGGRERELSEDCGGSVSALERN
jgi:hypothetical protein